MLCSFGDSFGIKGTLLSGRNEVLDSMSFVLDLKEILFHRCGGVEDAISMAILQFIDDILAIHLMCVIELDWRLLW